jgi:hypothetical protein
MERRLQLLPGMVKVVLQDGDSPAEIVPVLLHAARLAREQRLHDLLIVSGVDDPATAEAVSMAVDEIHGLGEPQFNIAFVACAYPQYAAYHFAEVYAARFGIAAKVLLSIRDAKEWLRSRKEYRVATTAL